MDDQRQRLMGKIVNVMRPRILGHTRIVDRQILSVGAMRTCTRIVDLQTSPRDGTRILLITIPTGVFCQATRTRRCGWTARERRRRTMDIGVVEDFDSIQSNGLSVPTGQGETIIDIERTTRADERFVC